MGGNVSDNETETFSWCNNDELKIKKEPFDTHPALTAAAGGPYSGTAKASSSASSSSTLFQYFVGMGYPDKLVQKAIEENGEGDADSILNSLLTYAALASSPQTEQDAEIPPQIEQDTDFNQKLDDDSDQKVNTDSDEKSDPDYELWSSDSEDDSSDPDFRPGREGNSATLTDKEQKLLVLADMGYSVEEASVALDNCGSGSSIEELADFICASQMAKSEDTPHIDPSKQIVIYDNNHKKRKMEWEEVKVEYDNVKLEYQDEDEDEKWHSRLLYSDEPIRLPKPMIGFGIPADPNTTAIHRYLPDIATGPPYFYYENVALAPKGVWDTISRFLYEVEPEFVDSKYFCAAARKRGYIHNLPIQNRCPLLPLPPRTIQEVLPLTQRWWPRWDKRTKMNCLQTAIASAKLTERIRKALEEYDGDPPPHVQKYVLDECKKWNLVWVGRNKAAPLEPDEVEMLLGFPRNHTRGGGISRTDRYKSLGNSFQVDTVAYHLSVLKDIFHGGITVLSLFSGIGGAEVALHRLGIPLKAVVSVEKSRVNRDIVSSWWEQTNQKGILIDIEDVQLLTEDRLKQLMESLGGFDLVIGGSPCNNLAGSNRVSRDGLEGKESSLFFEYCRILDSVRRIMARK